MNRLNDSRRDWLAVKGRVAGGHEGFGPGLVEQARANYEHDLIARIEELMNAKAGRLKATSLARSRRNGLSTKPSKPHEPVSFHQNR